MKPQYIKNLTTTLKADSLCMDYIILQASEKSFQEMRTEVHGLSRPLASGSHAPGATHLGDGAPRVLLRFDVWFFHGPHVFRFGFGTVVLGPFGEIKCSQRVRGPVRTCRRKFERHGLHQAVICFEFQLWGFCWNFLKVNKPIFSLAFL